MTNLDIYPNGVPFLKMHGLGNDFVIIDARESESPVNAQIAKVIGDRHFGVGYDQLVVITKSKKADVEVVFWNSDGSLSDACGNASRCVAKLIMDENNLEEVFNWAWTSSPITISQLLLIKGQFFFCKSS